MENIKTLAANLRKHVVRMTHNANSPHIGGCLSSADIVAALYGKVLCVFPEEPTRHDRDRFILSKGHSAAIVYAALAERGFFPKERLEDFCRDGSPFVGSVSHRNVPGVEASTGSLGHGLPIACGMALALRHDSLNNRVYVLMSDGECDEGSVWEAALFAGHHKISNLTVFIDYNKIQSFGFVSEVLDLEPLRDKWQAFRWDVQEIDGHDHAAIINAAERAKTNDKPSIIISHTVKGKGVSFMENQLLWHYRSPTGENLENALRELDS